MVTRIGGKRDVKEKRQRSKERKKRGRGKGTLSPTLRGSRQETLSNLYLINGKRSSNDPS